MNVHFDTLSADGVVLEEGAPVSIFGVNDTANGNTVVLYDGIDDTGTMVVSMTSDYANQIYNFPYGIVFPNGCYVVGVTGSLSILYKKV